LSKAQANVGMVMIFTLVSAAQEWMNNYSDKEKQKQQDNEDERREKEMEAELVSIRTFVFLYFLRAICLNYELNLLSALYNIIYFQYFL